MRITKISEGAASGFPRAAFDRAYLAATEAPPADPAGEVARRQLIEASYAVVYRHRQAHEAADSLQELLEQSGDRLGREWHYAAQQRLFSFFVSLHSSLESTFYWLYFAGGQLKPDIFKHAASGNWQKIKPDATVAAFEAAWDKARLTGALVEVKASTTYKDFGEARNILAHRIAPSFEHLVTLQGEHVANAGEIDYVLRWRGEPVTEAVPQVLTNGEAALTSVWETAAVFFEAPPA